MCAQTSSAPGATPAPAQSSAAAAQMGAWGGVFALPNVAIHTHLLPNGKVLFWGRRDSPKGKLDEHFCTPQVWDPATGAVVATPQPKRQDGTPVNLFCSGHTLLPDGRVFVGGGHWLDSQGIEQAAIYDFRTNLWTALPAMNSGRWYPTAITLPDGRPLILSGSFLGANGKNTPHNIIPQVWNGNSWHNLVSFPGDVLELYPCMHVAPDGRLFMSGPLAQSWLLDPIGDGKWSKLEGGLRANARRDYTPSVMYDVGKIIYIGGGNNPGEGDQPPTSAVEHIDLTVPAPSWTPTVSMHFPRRQHNATLLPDGTVLVTGGTRGPGFNDLHPNQPVHEAELWDPSTGQWTVLAAERVDRCYHSTAILLPDATVLSAGGGEYKPHDDIPNPPEDTHRDAQIYKPPYLFRGPGPQLTQAPTEVQYGETFDVATPAPNDIAKVSWLRLASTTHTNNMNQRINFLRFQVDGNKLRVTSPDTPQHCPPGHYMLFLLNKQGVPSTAKIIHIAPSQAHAQQLAMVRAPAPAPKEAFFTTEDLDRQVLAKASGTHAVLGLTSQCPYGLGACWGGAYEALQKLDGVNLVRPIANAEDSTADVWLVGDIVPDVHRWKEQIAQSANGSYHLRGVEISITASLLTDNGTLFANGPHLASPLPLRPLGSTPKAQYDRTTKQARPATAAELTAYERLLAQAQSGAAMPSVRVTGPLVHDVDGWALHVRGFKS
jgi:galactose oxidase